MPTVKYLAIFMSVPTRSQLEVFLTYFLLVGKKRGDGFHIGFQKWIMYTFMAHPSGWDIKYKNP